MKKSIIDSKKIQKNPPGSPPRGSVDGIQISVRLSEVEVAQLDAWIAEQRERLGLDLSRPAAIRAFITMGLKRTGPDY
jgi:hypothetical protein